MDTVFVGLSGGVDSAVSAYLLKKQGYKVVGAFIKGWEPDFLPCTGVRDRLEAMRVAAHLGIPFVTYDLSEEYKRGVVDYFVTEYKLGRTPNPDVMCNRVIKFGAFWEKAKADGADMIATGHYAQKKMADGSFQMAVSEDMEKDQTYFLWTLKQDDLAHSLFPVGGLEKTTVRSLALEVNLPNASRADSQGLCFLGHVDMHAFLKRYLPTEIGVVRDENGKSIGSHDGIWFYTLGQRHGFGSLGGERLYVVAKDRTKNELIVSTSPLGENAKKSFALTNESSVDGSPLVGKYLGRYRYRQALLPVEIRDGQASFDTPQRIASGQSLVVYERAGEIMHGGAIIE